MSEFDHWQTRYGVPDYVFGTAPNAFLVAQAPRLRRYETALAVADGEGRNGVWLAEQGLDVLAIDYSPTAPRQSPGAGAERGVSLPPKSADITDWRWPKDRHSTSSRRSSSSSPSPTRPTFFANLESGAQARRAPADGRLPPGADQLSHRRPARRRAPLHPSSAEDGFRRFRRTRNPRARQHHQRRQPPCRHVGADRSGRKK